MPFRFRDATLDDLDQLWRLDQECFPPGIAYSKRELTHFMTSRGAFTVLAETIGGNLRGLAGFILAEEQQHTRGHIVTIDVSEEARRKGLGTALMSIAERRLTQSGCTVMDLETAVNNLKAIRFYEKQGYEKTGIIRGYYQGKLDAYRMEKPLEDGKKSKKNSLRKSGG